MNQPASVSWKVNEGLCNVTDFSFRCDSIEKLKARLPSLEVELKDQFRFKDFYHFTFNYAKNPGQKGLDLEMAIAYWNIVLQGKFRFLDLWCKFLQVRCLICINFKNWMHRTFMQECGTDNQQGCKCCKMQLHVLWVHHLCIWAAIRVIQHSLKFAVVVS
jgi:hypothetical protein